MRGGADVGAHGVELKVDDRPAILHVITGLGQGGAERQLGNLVGYGRRSCRTAVFSIRPPGVMAGTIKGHGVPIFTGEARTPLIPSWLIALRETVRVWSPGLVVGWMYHGNLAASFVRLFGYDGPVVWNIRHSIHDLKQEKWQTRSVIRIGARVSNSASRIFYNSQTAAGQHERLGYRDQGRVVLPNGFEIQRFEPDPFGRTRLRNSMGIPDNGLVLGVVGRSHPMKNHVGWVRAFAKLVRDNGSLHCLMMGVGVDDPSGSVAQAISEAGLLDRVHFLPPTDAPETIYPAMDLLVLPSAFGEGVSNVVGEAMACGVPAAVTDVGDSAALVGETGFVIKGIRPDELAAGVEPAIRLGQGALADLGRRARQRVSDHYSLEAIGKRYYAVLREILDEHGS